MIQPERGGTSPLYVGTLEHWFETLLVYTVTPWMERDRAERRRRIRGTVDGRARHEQGRHRHVGVFLGVEPAQVDGDRTVEAGCHGGGRASEAASRARREPESMTLGRLDSIRSFNYM